ncbi:MAG: ABC transporter ATP-binding protein [Candidatus Thorarchaeota archaeon]|nr:MAG: ABC transporter ATP-binding protein [Candidatus Thorarchaeota archaeon]
MDEDTVLGSHIEDEEIDIDELDGLDIVRSAVRLEGVSRTFKLGKRRIEALRQVTLDVKPGEFVVISGHSGSGKTTLLNIIGAIDVASEGRVIVMDVPIGDYDETFRSNFRLQNTGFIFQSYNLISTLTALENVMFPMQLSTKPIGELTHDAQVLLTTVGLEERFDHLPWQLSSGEQQRVAIARAMANDPPIILADEPTANLDEDSAEMVRSLLRQLNAKGKAVIVMTHDLDIIHTESARHLKMSNGELI